MLEVKQDPCFDLPADVELGIENDEDQNTNKYVKANHLTPRYKGFQNVFPVVLSHAGCSTYSLQNACKLLNRN